MHLKLASILLILSIMPFIVFIMLSIMPDSEAMSPL